uniref:SJCHGC03079 protein n=1 Tax=Schistosoma japonicum TaxID=6182 RepID=Q5DHR7_SCHJA|nr:SJCHGC03079 protein [Schistosoma japonicum]
MLSSIYKEYQHEKIRRKAKLEAKKQAMLFSINQMINGLLTKIDENVSKVPRLNSWKPFWLIQTTSSKRSDVSKTICEADVTSVTNTRIVPNMGRVFRGFV